MFLHTHKVYHGDLKSADVLLVRVFVAVESLTNFLYEQQGESLRVKGVFAWQSLINTHFLVVGDIGFARVLREHKDQIEPISSKTRSWKVPSNI